MKAGVPVREMYDGVSDAYRDDQETHELFEALKQDWDDPAIHLKMVSPFAAREQLNPDYIVCRSFTELAATTAMVDVFWKNCSLAFLLKKQIQHGPVEPIDLKFARKILDGFPGDHPIMNYFFSLSNDASWNIRSLQLSNETATFENWFAARPSTAPPTAFRCQKAFDEATDRIGYPELISDAKSQWDMFSRSLCKKP